MKVPISWLKDYISTTKSPKELSESFTSLGLLLDKPIIQLENGEVVLDLEHRFDRADWLSIIGCARDLAAFEHTTLTYPSVTKEPGKKPAKADQITIKVTCPEFVNRFKTKVIKNIKVGPSPEFIKTRLESYGLPSINNIVDITNYVMVEYGQTLHAQDIAKLELPEIVVRRAKAGERLTTLLGEEVLLDPDVFVLTQNDKATVIGGIVGGQTTAVDETTTAIVLDAGNYNQINIRKSSRKLKILNESVLRNDKFLHPQLVQDALERAIFLILKYAGGDYYDNGDYYPKPVQTKQMSLRFARIKQLSGIDVPSELVKELMTALEYKLTSETDTELTFQVPYFRTDVEVEDDLVSDVLRINNFNKIPVKAITAAPPKPITPQIYSFEDQLRDCMLRYGYHEYITDPLVKAQPSNTSQIKLENSVTSEKSALRTTLYETLSQTCVTYKKHNLKEVKVFEVGKLYKLDGRKDQLSSYKEIRALEAIYAHDEKSLVELTTELRATLYGILHELGIKNVVSTIDDKDRSTARIFQKIKSQPILPLGVLKLTSFTLFTEQLLAAQKTERGIQSDITHELYQDVTITVSPDTTFGELVLKIKDLSELVADIYLLDTYTLQHAPTTNQRALTLRIYFTPGCTTSLELIKEISGMFV